MLHHLKRWDRSLLLWMQEHLRKGGVTLFMKITTFLGNGGIIWIAACLCLLFRPEARRAAASGLISLLFSVMINNAMLKNLVARIRTQNPDSPAKRFFISLWAHIQFFCCCNRFPLYASALDWNFGIASRLAHRIFQIVSGCTLSL